MDRSTLGPRAPRLGGEPAAGHRQLELRGLRATHPRPLAAGADRIARRMAPADAWKHPYIDPNPAHVIAVDLYDLDDPLLHVDGLDGPVPSWTVTNARTRHCHIAYVLADPVARHDAARLEPWAYYCDVHAGLTLRLGADPAYAGTLTRNPLAPGDGVYTTWQRLEAYTLAELAESCPAKLPDRTIIAEGRNCELFTWAVVHAHRPAQARRLKVDGQRAAWWRDMVAAENLIRFPGSPLPDVEVRSISSSSARYAIRQFSEARFSARQRHRQKLWAAKQHDRNEARDVGIVVAYRHGQSVRELAERAGLKRSRVYAIIASASEVSIPPLQGNHPRQVV